MTASPPAVRAVVLDIEGTTGSLAHVRDVLFPYARTRMADWLTRHEATESGAAVVASARSLLGDPQAGLARVASELERWADDDVKAAPLKTLQALIWADGYAAGELQGHVYADVPSALARWQTAGIRCYIYSSGAVPAQRDWFSHTEFGDLTHLLDGYFDLTTAGAKCEPASYLTIAAAIGVAPSAVLFLSDVREELDAAARVGWQTLAVRRPEDPRGSDVPGHRRISSLADFTAPGAATRTEAS